MLLNSQAAASCVLLSRCGRMVDLFTLLILFYFFSPRGISSLSCASNLICISVQKF